MRFSNVLRSVLEALGIVAHPDITARFVGEDPDHASLRSGELHVVGNRQYQKWALLRCPCDCGETIMLSLSTKKRPRWTVAIDWLGRPTVQPSIRQTAGCYSHFWLRRGRLDWCADTGNRWPEGSRQV
jgi:Family of unknown function (DUF6527)